MSRHLSYVDTAAPSRAMRTGLLRGPTPQTVLDGPTTVSDVEKRGTRIQAKRAAVAADPSWDADGGPPLADVIAMLGAQR